MAEPLGQSPRVDKLNELIEEPALLLELEGSALVDEWPISLHEVVISQEPENREVLPTNDGWFISLDEIDVDPFESSR